MSDFIAVWLCIWVFPPALVDRVIDECGKRGKRDRLLPPRVVVYFVLTMCLFPWWSYEEVARLLTDGTMRAGFASAGRIATTAALSRARARLGPEPLKALFVEVTQPRDLLARDPAKSRRRIVTVDAAVLTMPDTVENLERFGGQRLEVEGRVLPQVSLVGLAESDSRRILRAVVGSSSGSASGLSRGLFDGLQPGDMLVADGEFADLTLVPHLRAAGADVLWQIDASDLPVHTSLPDGSYLSAVTVGGEPAAHLVIRVLAPGVPAPGVPAADELGGRRSHLITSIVDHRTAPRRDLITLHRRRWTIGDALEELSPDRPRGPQVLRSRWPDGVEQELWGFLLVHHATRVLTHTTTERDLIRRSTPSKDH